MQMYRDRENADLDLLRELLVQQLQVIECMKAERERSSTQERRIVEIEQKQEEIANRVEFLEREVPDLRYKVDRNAELEYFANPYSLNGDPLCNS
jgi:hypothetical protein